MLNTSLAWKPGNVPVELHALLRELSVDYPIAENGEGRHLAFHRIGGDTPICRVKNTGDTVEIEYNELSGAARGIGYALAEEDTQEQSFLRTLGIEFDSSRCLVMTVEAFKRNARRLALLGYNLIMIYTVDVYTLEEIPSFGHMRGRYSAADIREMDRCAHNLGIELIGYIQTLSHLDQFLRRPINGKYKDTESELLVNSPDTEELLDSMLRFWSQNLRSRRIHVGMDESHTLGRGVFMDKNGYEPAAQMYNRHLTLVRKICKKYGLSPMIWSDMYFKMGNPKCDYYDLSWVIPEGVCKGRPTDVQLVYWDYYHFDEAFYATMIDRHVKMLGQIPVVSPCIRTCKRMWHDHKTTMDTIAPCLTACRAKKIPEVIVTTWVDDFLFCEPESTYSGLQWTADRAFGVPETQPVERRFAAICHGDWNFYCLMASIDGFRQERDHTSGFFTFSILWDDPLMGFTWRRHKALNVDMNAYQKKLKNILQQSNNFTEDPAGAHFDFARSICRVLLAKLALRQNLEDAWHNKDRKALECVATQDVPEALNALEEYKVLSRREWFRWYRPQGLEVHQIRLAGVQERCRECARRIEEFLEKGIPLAELDEPSEGFHRCVEWRYRLIATGIGSI